MEGHLSSQWSHWIVSEHLHTPLNYIKDWKFLGGGCTGDLKDLHVKDKKMELK